MSNHRYKQEIIILFFITIFLIFFGVMSLRNPYWTGYAFITILLSALITWTVAGLFLILMEGIFDIRINIRGEATLGYKYTTQTFGLIFTFIMFLTTSLLVFVIDQNLSVALIPFAEKYRDGVFSKIVGWFSIVLGIGSLILFMSAILSDD